MNWKEQCLLDMTTTQQVDYSQRVKYICETGDVSYILVGDAMLLCGTVAGRIMHCYVDDGFGNAVKR